MRIASDHTLIFGPWANARVRLYATNGADRAIMRDSCQRRRHMQVLKLQLFVAMIAISLSAAARNGQEYDCGNLKSRGGRVDNPFIHYSVEVKEDVVVLISVHGDPKRGPLSTTRSLMNRAASAGEMAHYEAMGIAATFLTTLINGRAHTSLAIGDDYGNSATCQKI